MSWPNQSATLSRTRGLLLALAIASCGCFWQQQSYTTTMVNNFSNYERRAQLDAALSAAYRPPNEFPMWIRPIKPTDPVQVPEERKDLVAWFQDAGAQLEVIVMGSAGPESLLEFQRVAIGNVNTAHLGPTGDQLTPLPPESTNAVYGGQASFERFSGETSRQVGQNAQPVAYNWQYYFAEDGSQKVMIVFVVPQSRFAELQKAMDLSASTLALGSNLAKAEASGLGGTP